MALVNELQTTLQPVPSVNRTDLSIEGNHGKPMGLLEGPQIVWFISHVSLNPTKRRTHRKPGQWPKGDVKANPFKEHVSRKSQGFNGTNRRRTFLACPDQRDDGAAISISQRKAADANAIILQQIKPRRLFALPGVHSIATVRIQPPPALVICRAQGFYPGQGASSNMCCI